MTLLSCVPVQVKLTDVHTDEEHTFECRRWIGLGLDNGELCRELPTTESGLSREYTHTVLVNIPYLYCL